MENNICISLLTDFGLKNPYVGAIKGVIHSICPESKIIDISHSVKRWNIIEASYILECSYKYFPKDAIFVVVVDPGVGTRRKPIVIKTENYIFVGPDNGVLIRAASMDNILEIHEIKNRRYMLEKISYTFHGRDIFAPVAAHIACGLDLDKLGPRITKYIDSPIPNPRIENNCIKGIIYFIDEFGNIATNIPAAFLDKLKISYGMRLRVKTSRGEYLIPFVKSFGYVEVGKPLLQINSCKKVELAINRGSAKDVFKLKPCEEIVICQD